ncbi:hypothetical protein SOVF_142950 isoform B [Spinacia oleracea]|nr:hypothetical protein SOVF_142950 isoform B [Spinacia oleracea]
MEGFPAKADAFSLNRDKNTEVKMSDNERPRQKRIEDNRSKMKELVRGLNQWLTKHWSGVGVTLVILAELASGSSLLLGWLLFWGV